MNRIEYVTNAGRKPHVFDDVPYGYQRGQKFLQMGTYMNSDGRGKPTDFQTISSPHEIWTLYQDNNDRGEWYVGQGHHRKSYLSELPREAFFNIWKAM